MKILIINAYSIGSRKHKDFKQVEDIIRNVQNKI